MSVPMPKAVTLPPNAEVAIPPIRELVRELDQSQLRVRARVLPIATGFLRLISDAELVPGKPSEYEALLRG